ncbi:penicillin-binding protein 2 [Paraburkholderia bannensis]|uniref:hypothetical protein n=1 Tax=Paraburkholderia bannensis TaxID=765414 RepID=UPI0038991979
MDLPTRTVWLDATAAGAPASASQIGALAHILQIDPAIIEHAYASHRHFVYLSRQVPTDSAERAIRLDLPGVFAQKDYRRFYPESAVAANVVGFTGIDGNGQEGIERSADRLLHGVDGWRRTLHNARGQVIANLAQSAPRNGTDVRLSLDLPVQYAAYHALKETVTVDRIKSDTVATINVSQRGGHPARCRKISAEATPASTSPLSANFRYRPTAAFRAGIIHLAGHTAGAAGQRTPRRGHPLWQMSATS